MRVVAGTKSGATAATAVHPRSEKFKAQLKSKLKAAQAPDSAWGDFRAVARSLFGDAAFLPKRPGENFRRLDFSSAQLRQLADHPAKVVKHIHTLQSQGKFPKDSKKWSASEAAKLYARSARSVLPAKSNSSNGANGSKGETFTIATVNDDFTDRRTNLKHVKASVILAQETTNTDVRHVLAKDTWGVHQNTHRVDQAGTSVIWKRDDAKVLHSGYAMGVRPHGVRMHNRWINWTDMKIGDQKVRMISVHRPPRRYSRLWPQFDANLAAFVRHSKLPVVIGMDANQVDPHALAKKTGLKWNAPKGSIDGFLTSPGVRITKMWRLPKGSSDHNPVVAQIHLPPKQKA